MVIHGLRDALIASGNFPELLTAEQVSALLGVSAATLNRWAAIRETTGQQIGLFTDEGVEVVGASLPG